MEAVAARNAVNLEVKTGRMPHPNTLPCTDCGHTWKPGERRHEYDHHKGYSVRNRLKVQAVCTTCHHRRDNPRSAQTACVNGHPFTPENTYQRTRPGGGRACRACRRAYDKRRSGRRG